MKFAQVLYDKAHWIFEAHEKPEFTQDIVLIDITNLNPQPQEGWDYVGGVFKSPEDAVPYTERLAKAREVKLSELYAAFTKVKESIVWSENYGYDADPGSLLDFRNAKDRARDLRDVWVGGGKMGDEPTVPYRVYLLSSGRAFIEHTHDMFVMAQETGAVMQMAAFARFAELRAAIETAKTVEDVQAISWQ